MLEVKGASKLFGEKMIFNQIDFLAKRGEIHGIVGPSGSGKTTFLRCLCGLETFDSGTMSVNGNQSETAQRIGLVFQDFQLFPHLTVIENLMLVPVKKKQMTREQAAVKAQEWLEMLGIEGQSSQYPTSLSGGQKQRVAIARALMLSPKVLCYDEPTSALDVESRNQVGQIMQLIQQQGMTQIIVTHDVAFTNEYCHQIFDFNK
ncbi:amino acid ABC transporter ATP-binding protein [Vagococcus lutrae]|uniref:amino acid ABC transporter ATP-binding protein n=1 Tax=Vagococcus lutrae TaxID=81947 RepID=UPI00200C9011|nr:ATP-binding cassette domain-containing protein [Vagococcus lutrae]MDT2823205.1 ATP-binding cassette domain-containing protein [Vagococcus lutrae]UQF19728.1 ATP-binding cassette domain-containing protein [Vagococcus lutrae]